LTRYLGYRPRYKATADALGINDPDWMASEVAARESARAPR